MGELSNVLCAVPEPVLDYFEAYRNAGGQAGGGLCAFGRAPGGVAALIFGLAGLGVALRRGSRRRGAR